MVSRIQDRVIKVNVQKFIDNWRICQRALQANGYTKSTMETYHLSQRMITENRKSIEDIKYSGDIDSANLQKMMKLQKADAMTFVAMHYPVMSDFKAFYYKKREKEVHNLINEHCGEGEAVNIDRMVDALDEIKGYVTTGSDLYGQVCNELTVLEAIKDFMDVSDDASYQVSQQTQSHVNAIQMELKRAKNRLVASEYFELERKRIKQLEDLGNRVMMTIDLMLNISEN